MSKEIKYLVIGGLIVLAAMFIGGQLFSKDVVVQETTTIEQPKKDKFGNLVNYETTIFTNGLQNVDTFQATKYGLISNDKNYFQWRNTTGRTVYVDELVYITTGVASSSYIFDAYSTSTTWDNLGDFNDPVGTLVDGDTLATSSVSGTVRSSIDGGSADNKVISVVDGNYLTLSFRSLQGCTTSGQCEIATSTRRGFNVNWMFSYFRQGDR